MIQRIQSLYLFVVAVISGMILFSPLADLYAVEAIDNCVLDYRGIVHLKEQIVLQNTWALTAIAVIIPVISLVTLFLFKNRMLQIRMTIVNIMLQLGFYIILAVYLYVAVVDAKLDLHLKPIVVFPLICVVFNYLAIRAIGKDEALIRSLNRVRK